MTVTAPSVTRLRVEHLLDPFIDAPAPRFSWNVSSARNGARQVAYLIRCASSAELLAAGDADVWHSGRVESDRCWLVDYAGAPLASRQRVFFAVTVWDDEGAVSGDGPVGSFEMGLLEPGDWRAKWIAAQATDPSGVTYLRGEVMRVDSAVVRARAYVTALGLYELRCNGGRVGRDYFTPGWTDYAKRIQYQVLDLTDHLCPGDNTLEALLADGWYAGYIGFVGERAHYGATPQFLAQVEIETATGVCVFTTDLGWQAGVGRVVTSDMLMGETQHLGRSTRDWLPARVAEGTGAPRSLSAAPPVRVLDELEPVAVQRVGPDTHRVDLGQNITGWLRLLVSADAETTLTVRHAEVCNEDGTLYLANLRAAEATDRYTLAGNGIETCEPLFTFHGFRYAEITGYAGALSASDVTGVVVGTDVELVGDFACSDERVNQLHSNIVWGARGNFLDVPTDCPQRDERLGWMGDAQVFAPTAGALFDIAGFFTKWLRDVVDAQSERGGFSNVSPRVVDMLDGVPGWGDAGVIVPWVVAGRHADERLLAACYPAMRAWVRFIHDANPTLLWLEERSHDLGDWLHIDAETDKDLIATAFFAWSTQLTARAADVLGRADDSAELHALADGIRAAFRDAFLSGDGQLKSGTQTAYALALRFGLVPPEVAAQAVDHLVADIERRDTHLSTGFLGVAHLLPALSAGGRNDVAYRLLCQDTFPSWLYAVDAGATTIWERWDGWTAEKGFQDPAMNSFNHYAFGAVGEWLYETVGGLGLDPFEPRRMRIAPATDASLGWVRAHTLTPLGIVGAAWNRDDGGMLSLSVDIPVGATAAVSVPNGATIEVGSGHHEFRSS